jgi:hypothetical protein
MEPLLAYIRGDFDRKALCGLKNAKARWVGFSRFSMMSRGSRVSQHIDRDILSSLCTSL